MGTQVDIAPQHGPRPLPLFMAMLRNETAANPTQRLRALAGLRAYQDAPRPRRDPPRPAVATDGRVTLRDYGGGGRPVVFVPSLINPAFVLDIAPDNSLLRFLATRGVRPLLVDWGMPTVADRSMDLRDHARAVIRLCARLDGPPVLVGYCLGGTIALAAAAGMAVAGVALIATPWRFDGFGTVAGAALSQLWEPAEPVAAALGMVPMEVLQAGFWQLDPQRTVAKFAAFADLDPAGAKAQEFVALEDWANAGAPIPYAAAREMFDDLFDADLSGSGRWRMDGIPVRPLAMDVPMVEFVAANDRIVPAASAIGLPDQRMVQAGHVGMIVGRRGRDLLWEPLADWLSRVSHSR